MTKENGSPDTEEQDLATRFPTAYTILFLLIILVAALTWIIPAGQETGPQTSMVAGNISKPLNFCVR